MTMPASRLYCSLNLNFDDQFSKLQTLVVLKPMNDLRIAVTQTNQWAFTTLLQTLCVNANYSLTNSKTHFHVSVILMTDLHGIMDDITIRDALLPNENCWTLVTTPRYFLLRWNLIKQQPLDRVPKLWLPQISRHVAATGRSAWPLLLHSHFCLLHGDLLEVLWVGAA